MSIKSIIAGNWKMNLDRDAAKALCEGLLGAAREDVTVLLCPSFIHIPLVQQLLNAATSTVKLGAQDLYFEDNGAYTGEVSAEMLCDYQCEYVILGHSERRQYMAETNQIVNQKIRQALRYHLKPILCVGETLAERESGNTYAVIQNQLENSLSGIELDQLVIAYEPVWAIGTGKVASPEQAEDVHAFIRRHISNDQVPILYGGSVKPDNAASLLGQANINGALVGGASLSANTFTQIIQAV